MFWWFRCFFLCAYFVFLFFFQILSYIIIISFIYIYIILGLLISYIIYLNVVHISLCILLNLFETSFMYYIYIWCISNFHVNYFMAFILKFIRMILFNLLLIYIFLFILKVLYPLFVLKSLYYFYSSVLLKFPFFLIVHFILKLDILFE